MRVESQRITGGLFVRKVLAAEHHAAVKEKAYALLPPPAWSGGPRQAPPKRGISWRCSRASRFRRMNTSLASKS